MQLCNKKLTKKQLHCPTCYGQTKSHIPPDPLPWTVSGLFHSFKQGAAIRMQYPPAHLTITVNQVPLHCNFPTTSFIQTQRKQRQHLPFHVDQVWYYCQSLTWAVPDAGGHNFQTQVQGRELNAHEKSTFANVTKIIENYLNSSNYLESPLWNGKEHNNSTLTYLSILLHNSSKQVLLCYA